MRKPTKKDWIKLSVVLTLYLIFLVWVKSWLGLLVVPFIVDNYITKFIPWGWWKKSENALLRQVMSWVDAIVFALVAVYFVNLYFFQNYVIPTSSLEKSLLVGDYLFVSKMSYGPRKPQTPLSMPLTQHTMPVTGTKSYLDCIQWPYERIAGLGEIELNDIVVFNYPAGDTVTTNPDVIDYYAECYLLGEKRYPNKPQMDSLTIERQRAVYDLYYAAGREYIEKHPEQFGEKMWRPVAEFFQVFVEEEACALVGEYDGNVGKVVAVFPVYVLCYFFQKWFHVIPPLFCLCICTRGNL